MVHGRPLGRRGVRRASRGRTAARPLTHPGRAARSSGSSGAAPHRPRLVVDARQRAQRASRAPRPRSSAACCPREPISTEPLKDTIRRASERLARHPNPWIVACDYADGHRVAVRAPGSPPAELADAVAGVLCDSGLLPPGQDRRPPLRRRRPVVDLEPRHPARVASTSSSASTRPRRSTRRTRGIRRSASPASSVARRAAGSAAKRRCCAQRVRRSCSSSRPTRTSP